MKRFLNWKVTFGVLLLSLSFTFYAIHFTIFRDTHHIFLYLIGDIAFLFIDVFIVVLVLDQLMEYRQKRELMQKLNMVIGTFFSEVGTGLMRQFSRFDPAAARFGASLIVTDEWDDRKFREIHRLVTEYDCGIESRAEDLEAVRNFLKERRSFLLGLLQNPNLLEHESFSNLLWAVFHLTDELIHRGDLSRLPAADLKHLAGDMRRAYRMLIDEWLEYMKHLKTNYPYLFSLAIRTNPFDANASVEIREPAAAG
jgi:hypothetical protein